MPICISYPEAARQLVAKYGPNATLGEVEQRLGDLLKLVGVVSEVDPRHVLEAPRVDGVWTSAVREILFAQLDRTPLSLPSVARMLAVSPRTLQRRLTDEGTSWRAEIDTARKERTMELLWQGTTSEATAAHVGYSGSRALRRALRRWNREDIDA